MYRFFVDSSKIDEDKIIIDGQDFHHIKNVLRMKIGEKIYISSGDEWEYTCEKAGFESGFVNAKILDIQKPGQELASKITLYQCMPKKEKMEQIITKSVELGAYKIVPVMSSRCIAKLRPEKSADRIARWNTISKTAAKQAKRLIEPEVAPVMTFKDAVGAAALSDIALIPYEKAEGMAETRQLLGKIRPTQSVSVIIGPEGGFDEGEIELAIKAGIKPITLGKRILRTETAGPAVLSVLMYLLEGDE